MPIKHQLGKKVKQPKPRVKVISVSDMRSLCKTDDPCGNCIHGDAAAATGRCEAAYAEAKIRAQEKYPDMTLVRVRTRRVKVSGPAFRRGKPYTNYEGNREVRLQRVFTFQ